MPRHFMIDCDLIRHLQCSWLAFFSAGDLEWQITQSHLPRATCQESVKIDADNQFHLFKSVEIALILENILGYKDI